jgi:hypothetical protein
VGTDSPGLTPYLDITYASTPSAVAAARRHGKVHATGVVMANAVCGIGSCSNPDGATGVYGLDGNLTTYNCPYNPSDPASDASGYGACNTPELAHAITYSNAASHLGAKLVRLQWQVKCQPNQKAAVSWVPAAMDQAFQHGLIPVVLLDWQPHNSCNDNFDAAATYLATAIGNYQFHVNTSTAPVYFEVGNELSTDSNYPNYGGNYPYDFNIAARDLYYYPNNNPLKTKFPKLHIITDGVIYAEAAQATNPNGSPYCGNPGNANAYNESLSTAETAIFSAMNDTADGPPVPPYTGPYPVPASALGAASIPTPTPPTRTNQLSGQTITVTTICSRRTTPAAISG